MPRPSLLEYTLGGQPRYRIWVARELFKFSCAHMTVFPDGRKERLHGHNYTMRIALDLAGGGFEEMVDFAALKRLGSELAQSLRERVLLPEQNPYLAIARLDPPDAAEGEVEFTLSGKRYVLPREDVALLPIENASAEGLAGYASGVLAEGLERAVAPALALGLEVSIEENPGQGASCYHELAGVETGADKPDSANSSR